MFFVSLPALLRAAAGASERRTYFSELTDLTDVGMQWAYRSWSVGY